MATNKLSLAITELLTHQRADDAAGIARDKRCLEYVRGALGAVGLKLPPPTAENTALANYEELVGDPGKYGFKQIHSPLTGVCLVYFGNCGKLPDGRIAGHIAILNADKKITISNQNYTFTQWWADRIVGAFVPAE